MFEICRPTGRLFLCAGLFLGMVIAAWGATPATTTVSDVIYRADGTVARGTLLISWGFENDRNLLGRFGTRVIELPRFSRVQTYFVRLYDNATPPSYSAFSTVIHIDYPL